MTIWEGKPESYCLLFSCFLESHSKVAQVFSSKLALYMDKLHEGAFVPY
jgi:hypothetical protein